MSLPYGLTNNMSWVVYILRCSDGTLYTGITNNVDARMEEHNAGTGAKYTRGRTPVRLVYQADVASRSAALKEEYRLKQLSRREKQLLIEGYAQGI